MTKELAPPHEIRDPDKLESMVKFLEAGGTLPPIIATGDTAISGSHRIVAWEIVDLPQKIVQVEDEDYCAAMRLLDLDPIYDHCNELDDLVAALRNVGADLEDGE